MASDIGEIITKFWEKYDMPGWALPDCVADHDVSIRFPNLGGYDSYPVIWMLLEMLDGQGGNFLEIGALEGTLTTILAEWARKQDKSVIVIDPYDGNQQGTEEKFKAFKRRMRKYLDVVHLYRVSSLSDEGKRFIAMSDPVFAWVDGLHTYEAVKSDIETVKACNQNDPCIIGVHDIRGQYRFCDDMMRALQEASDSVWHVSAGPDNCPFGFLWRD